MGDEARLLSLHPLLPWIDRALTVLMWREGALSPKVRALRNVLTAHAAHRTRPPTLGRTAGDQSSGLYSPTSVCVRSTLSAALNM
jgi:hypothetical protein